MIVTPPQNPLEVFQQPAKVDELIGAAPVKQVVDAERIESWRADSNRGQLITNRRRALSPDFAHVQRSSLYPSIPSQAK